MTSFASADPGELYEPTPDPEPPHMCHVCEKPVGEGHGGDWTTALDGRSAHVSCLEDAGVWDRAPREDDDR